METDDAFRGTPFNAKPTEEWNRPPFWDGFYRDLFAKPDSWDRDQVVHRDAELLIQMLTAAGELPRRSAPQTILDAGCGVALIPHVLAFWGFRVTAADSCRRAVEEAARRRPSEEELARCVPIWDSVPDRPGICWLTEDAARSLQRLRSFQAADGAVSYLHGDWFDADLRPGAFGLVYCRNGLRCAAKPYWRRSLRRFHELLSPGGVLLLENVNAIGIRGEVEELLVECGFQTLPAGAGREPSAKYVIAMWPTG